MFEEKSMKMEIGGRTLKMSTGKLARQASGSVLLSYGETSILATVVGAKEKKDGIDFFPLTVDYMEKFYSAGKMPGGFYKREAKPSVDSTLTARLIDRPLRPLFPEDFKNEVQIVITVLSYDGESTPDYLGIIGASAALSISEIPFAGPAAGVNVGYINGEYVLNPTPEQIKESEIDLAVAGTKDAITMVEAGAKEVSEELMLGAIMFGHENIKKICAVQEEFAKIAGKEKMQYKGDDIDQDAADFLKENAVDKLKEAVSTKGKLERENAVNTLEEDLLAVFKEKYKECEELDFKVKMFKNQYHELMKKLVREVILYNHNRVDGRKIDEIRPIAIEIDLIPKPHGTALFTRGETQALVITTLGTKDDEQIVDGLDKEVRKNFFLHYNFPAFSVGEIGFMRGPGRRELGHGALAERALKYVMPEASEFPYTVRVVSEILESNGSSSMASVCGGSLSLMAAGVPIKSSVAGVAMGLIKEGDDFVVLTDIMGLEDHLGDMDFKVAGTRNGITALQMDIKITGINEDIMRKALAQALEGRFFIIGKMENIINKSKDNISPNAPRIKVMEINPEKIAGLIGPAGKNIKAIIEQTEAKIDIEDNGIVRIFSSNEEMLLKTVKLIERCVKDVSEGEVFDGKVTKLLKFGALVEIAPGKEGLLHISEISDKRVKEVEDVLKTGDAVKVKVLKLEPNGKIALSMKALIKKEEEQPQAE